MLDPDLQQKFARRCADAAFGYQAASTAACAAFTDQVLSFWSGVLQPPPPPPPKRELDLWRWPVPMAPSRPALATPAPSASPFFNPFAWMVPQEPPPPPKPAVPALPGNPWEAMAQFAGVMSDALSSMTSMQVKPVATPSNPMSAWLALFPFAPPTSAWPMAFMMMSQGVPHAIAWPTAEANAAVLDAADVARQSIKQVFASYQSEGGYAAGGNTWPPTNVLTMMAMVPLNVGTMLTAMRMH
jgi:hypothetical protein